MILTTRAIYTWMKWAENRENAAGSGDHTWALRSIGAYTSPSGQGSELVRLGHLYQTWKLQIWRGWDVNSKLLIQAFAELLLRVGSTSADASVACAVGSLHRKSSDSFQKFPMSWQDVWIWLTLHGHYHYFVDAKVFWAYIINIVIHCLCLALCMWWIPFLFGERENINQKAW